MIKTKNVYAALFTANLILINTLCSAQVVDISGCRAIDDRLKRFDCYESLGQDNKPQTNAEVTQSIPAEPTRENTAPATAPPVSAQTAPKASAEITASQNLDNFGRAPDAAAAKLIEDERGQTELVDTVAKIEQRGPNLAVITLSSGQRWLQVISKRYPMRAGDEVKIYPTRFGGAFRLTATKTSGFIQVERLE
ncbi:MAG: hypothetical protein V4628_08500 [Pseudomonadota bacterium]